MLRKIVLFVICLLPFALYHSNTGHGPDSVSYLAVAHSIMTQGHLNTTPSQLDSDTLTQVTKSQHAPIHQNIGGVLFFLPATAFSQVSVRAATLIPGLPERLYDINYHEKLWVGCTAYLLALFFCLLIYPVLRRYFSHGASLAAILLCLYGGPLLIYTTAYPYQMALPAAFVAALLLYLYHNCDLEKKRSWLLLGMVWGLGCFVRAEFIVWGVLLLYALLAPRPQGTKAWRFFAIRVLMTAGGGLLFIVPGMMLRQVIFGTQGSTYGIQFDLEFLKNSTLMFFGTRNGLFTFWPILLVAMFGYLLKFRRNPLIHHALFAILVLECVICGSTNFWSGEFGNSFGQRRFLVVLPCFIFFLARLFDLSRAYLVWLASACLPGVFWALAMYLVYGNQWSFPDGTSGFLMPYEYPLVWSAVSRCVTERPDLLLKFVFLPKHGDVAWLLPLFAVVSAGGYALSCRLAKCRFTCGLITLLCLSCGLMVFLSGARQRGEMAFDEIVNKNPSARFVTRNYEINDEIVGSMVDSVAFFMELHQQETAQYFVDKAQHFLTVEAPDQLDTFQKIIQGLSLRQSLGWYRLVPEQNHMAVLEWYRVALLYENLGQAPPDISGQFLY